MIGWIDKVLIPFSFPSRDIPPFLHKVWLLPIPTWKINFSKDCNLKINLFSGTTKLKGWLSTDNFWTKVTKIYCKSLWKILFSINGTKFVSNHSKELTHQLNNTNCWLSLNNYGRPTSQPSRKVHWICHQSMVISWKIVLFLHRKLYLQSQLGSFSLWLLNWVWPKINSPLFCTK